MAAVAKTRARLAATLTHARTDDLERIRDGLRLGGVVGVHGEAEVGVTSLVAAVVRSSNSPCIRVDLDTATSEGDIAWQLARGLARLTLDPTALSLALLPDGLRPASADRAFVRFASQVGLEVADLARADDAPEDASVDPVLSALADLPSDRALPWLWIDHLGAPLVPSRHPLAVDELLWNVRALQQRRDAVVLLSGRRSATPVAFDANGAFHGDGLWVAVERPTFAVWSETVDDPAPRWLWELLELTRGHPATMLLGVALRKSGTLRDASPRETWDFLLGLDDGLLARAFDHARSLHRLGGETLERIARGLGPYEDAGTTARRKEVNRAVRRLHDTGLITQPRPRTWEITNPLIDGRLRHADGIA